jgi:hypothetical protein
MARLPWTRRLRRLLDAGRGKRALLAEALMWLLLARLALVAVPFPRLARRLGSFVTPGDSQTLQARTRCTGSQAQVAAQIGWAVTRAARLAPFKAVCLPQAMAARIMLMRRGVPSVLYFGASRIPGGPIDAHAWLDAAGVKVTGYPQAKNFAAIACFI